MQKIAKCKCVQNYSKYHSQIFAGKLPANPMSSYRHSQLYSDLIIEHCIGTLLHVFNKIYIPI